MGFNSRRINGTSMGITVRGVRGGLGVVFQFLNGMPLEMGKGLDPQNLPETFFNCSVKIVSSEASHPVGYK